MLLNNRYKIIRSLGGGGFGETFLAEDTQMPSQRCCVIKQLRPIQDNPQVYELVKQRFQREAAILEELGDGSDRIPRLYAYFTENGQFYLLTGKIPQELPTDPATGAILWRQYAPSITPNFASVLDRAIQYSPQNRFSSTREMLQVLQTDCVNSTPTVQQSSHPRTIPVSPGYSEPSVVQNSSSNKGIVFGSIIACGLIGASVVIGFAINKSSVISPSESQVNFPSESPVNSPSESPVTTASVEPTTAPTNSQNDSQSPSDDSTLTNPTPEAISPPTSPSPLEQRGVSRSPSVEKISPAQAVENYYLTINRGEYEAAWNQLSPNLQNNKRLHSNGYLSFIDWWGGKVQSIDVDRVNLVEENRDNAIVDAQLQYRLKTGKVAPGSVRFSLVWDVSSDRWVVVGVQ